MSYRARAITLLLVQCLLVSSIAAKYLYERMTRPRVWVEAAQFDPNLPMRGRYLWLSPIVNACNLPHDKESGNRWKDKDGQEKVFNWHWRVRTSARDGKLVVEDARDVMPRGDTETLWVNADAPCDRVRLSGMYFFIPDTAQDPFPTKSGQSLWVEVTVPPVGPPRPIQLAISENGEWKPLKLE